MSKATKLAKNTAILGLGRLSGQASSLILLPLYTSYLTPAEYGVVDLITLYTLLLVPSLTLQLEMASFRYLIDARGNSELKSAIVTNILYMAMGLFLPWLIAGIVIGLFFQFDYIWSVSLVAFSLIYYNLAQQITRGLGHNLKFALSSIILGLSTLILSTLAVAVLLMNINGILISVAISNLLAGSYLYINLNIHKHINPSLLDSKLQKSILGYSIPLVPNGISWWVLNASNRTIIAVMIGTAANGIYAISSKFSLVLSSAFSVFNMSWAESASINIDTSDRNIFFSRVANAAVRIFGGLSLTLTASIPIIFPLIIDDQFKDAYLYAPIIVIGVFFNVIVGVYSAVYIAKKQTTQVMNTSLSAAALNILLAITLIPFFGLYAAAASTTIAFLLMAIFRHHDVKKYVKITYDKNIFIILAILYATVMYFYYLNTIWASAVGLTLAIASAYWINKGEITRTLSLLKRRLPRNR